MKPNNSLTSRRAALAQIGTAGAFASMAALSQAAEPLPAPVSSPSRALSVRDFGAKGDSTTDDTASFQKALDSAGRAGGGIVFVPTGNFLLKGTITIPRAVTLEGVWSAPPRTEFVPHPANANAPRQLNGSVLLATAGKGEEKGAPFIRMEANATLPLITIQWRGQASRVVTTNRVVSLARGLEQALLVEVENSTTESVQLQVSAAPAARPPMAPLWIPAGDSRLFRASVLATNRQVGSLDVVLERRDHTLSMRLPLPGRVEEPALLRARLSDADQLGGTRDLILGSRRFLDMKAAGWIRGDTHIHWAKNWWSQDEDIHLLGLVQRAEDLRVAKNLTVKVPVDVALCFADSLDQIEPDDYYRFLDCGFEIPLSNGSDHPARVAGCTRVYVKTEAPFHYQRWIDGIRANRTFATSGPLLFLEVNGRSRPPSISPTTASTNSPIFA